jgi:hypothetical protein
MSNEGISFLFAINNNKLIYSCFGFVETEDGMQLAYMHRLGYSRGQGIGRQI